VLPILGFIQVIAGRQVGVIFEVFGSQRLADQMFLAEPFAQVHQFARREQKGPNAVANQSPAFWQVGHLMLSLRPRSVIFPAI